MKKILSIFVIITMFFCLCACGGTGGDLSNRLVGTYEDAGEELTLERGGTGNRFGIYWDSDSKKIRSRSEAITWEVKGDIIHVTMGTTTQGYEIDDSSDAITLRDLSTGEIVYTKK